MILARLSSARLFSVALACGTLCVLPLAGCGADDSETTTVKPLDDDYDADAEAEAGAEEEAAEMEY
ncbi:hypothetical protein [Alienimonas chondri]|uniref:Secreted protein n=1 Tax=Alienimonas chondri TaxID=2681879 RepID=A0ABX1VDU3_9PLAN|nr:hypothetical protein [Alienimonas chondri]NNJ25894.1 hypothetical protein [Alienimonas chondri]